MMDLSQYRFYAVQVEYRTRIRQGFENTRELTFGEYNSIAKSDTVARAAALSHFAEVGSMTRVTSCASYPINALMICVE